VDFDRVATVADVADSVVDGLRQLSVDAEWHLDRRLSRLGISLGTSGLKVRVEPRAAPQALSADRARAVISDLLALPGELSDDPAARRVATSPVEGCPHQPAGRSSAIVLVNGWRRKA